ncbi:MAG: hypothetical protein R3C05_25925 [Pirellulaceae bacterium]
MSDPFSVALSLGPLSVYLIVIGLMQSGRKPVVTTGAQDTAALGIGVSGFLMIGPLVLFFPTMAYGVLGWIVWAMLTAFYLLTLLLIILTMRPRMVIYGLDAGQVRAPMLRAAQSIDPDAKMEGEQIWFPSVGCSIRLDMINAGDVPQIVPQIQQISPRFWRRLLEAMRREVSTFENRNRSRGLGIVFVGTLMMILIASNMVSHPQEVVAGFRHWLRL